MNIFRLKWLMIVLLFVVLVPLGSSCGMSGPRAVKNIKTFARLYGYARYFHPSDEASKIDWERFAVYGVKRVEKAKSSEKLKKILEELFMPLAPGMVIYFSSESEEKAFDKTRIIPPGTDTREMKVVAWQHYGVGLSDTPNIYHSIRLNRKNTINLGSGFANLVKKKIAAPYRGKAFLYKAAVKVERGKAQMWFRVDRPNRQIGFFDNMDDRPIQSRQWKIYEIKGKIADDAKNIAYGCFMVGAGKIFADDFQLFVKEGDQWKPIEIKNPGFEGDTDGKPPQDWLVRGEGYHFQVTSRTASQGNKSFMMENKTVDGPMQLFPQHPSIGEHIRKELGVGLSCILPLALYGTETNTYPSSPAETFKNLSAALDKENPEEWTGNDLHVRMADVVIAWNVFQHFYPYFDVVKVDWDSVLTRTLQQARSDADEKDFLYTLKQMVAQLHDGHGGVYHPALKQHAGFPFKVEWIENQVVITVSEDKQFQRGDIILSIDGMDAEDALVEAETYISGSPQWKRWKSLARFGYGEKGTTALLKIKRDGQEMEITFTRNHNARIKEFYRQCIETLDDDIYYVDLNHSQAEKETSAAIEKLSKAKGIIFDARGYVKYGMKNILSYLVDETITSPVWNVPQVIYPDRERIVYTDSNWIVEPKKPKIEGKVVFLTRGSAISASETFMAMVEHYKLGEIVGQPTAGTNGNVNPFTLPGGYRVFWTGMRVLKHDHSQFHLIGIQPTVPMKRTLKGVKEGKDEFLEKAVEIIKGS